MYYWDIIIIIDKQTISTKLNNFNFFLFFTKQNNTITKHNTITKETTNTTNQSVDWWLKINKKWILLLLFFFKSKLFKFSINKFYAIFSCLSVLMNMKILRLLLLIISAAPSTPSAFRNSLLLEVWNKLDSENVQYICE